jgi:hypothetical protein
LTVLYKHLLELYNSRVIPITVFKIFQFILIALFLSDKRDKSDTEPANDHTFFLLKRESRVVATSGREVTSCDKLCEKVVFDVTDTDSDSIIVYLCLQWAGELQSLFEVVHNSS